ncbi:methyltransferase domain-containing protein [Sulfurimonas sp. HSL3-7]|uniref:methyltransferase domain-containing protein n=1 Tax=Sulfonitrofixus jiaomeiensis TaxID=3131938 RepID=UPI0031FA0419
MKVQNEFSRYADQYGNYNIIQEKVVRKLLADLKEKPKKILDLGCGKGALFNAIDWKVEHFVGVDFAPRMLELHPKEGDNVGQLECIYGDFNDDDLFEHLSHIDFDRIFSASALQWAADLERVFRHIASLKKPVSLAIFSGSTFKTLFEAAGVAPLLRSSEEVESLAKRYFNGDIEIVRYQLAFDSVREMFRYIKRSGVSGNRNLLGYKEMKKLMEEYPLDYLEFEVVFIQT